MPDQTAHVTYPARPWIAVARGALVALVADLTALVIAGRLDTSPWLLLALAGLAVAIAAAGLTAALVADDIDGNYLTCEDA
jgi:hypothetical protein